MQKFLATVDRSGGDPYTVTALVPKTGDDEDGALTINRLRAAGTAYPPEIRKQYLGVPEGAIPEGGDAEQLLDDILAEVEDPTNPYDVASTMVDYLQSPANFTYDADVRDLACEGLSTVECFARYQRGLLPVLRDDDGHPAPPARHPDAPGRRVPARRPRCGRPRERVGQRGACLGRGLLPRATAGWSSTRRAAALPLRCHCRPANRLHRRASAVQKTAAIPSGGATPVRDAPATFFLALSGKARVSCRRRSWSRSRSAGLRAEAMIASRRAIHQSGPSTAGTCVRSDRGGVAG